MQILLFANLCAKVVVASNPVFRVMSKHMIEVDVFFVGMINHSCINCVIYENQHYMNESCWI